MGCGHHARVREEAGMTSIDRERGDDITTVKTIEDVRAMKRARRWHLEIRLCLQVRCAL